MNDDAMHACAQLHTEAKGEGLQNGKKEKARNRG